MVGGQRFSPIAIWPPMELPPYLDGDPRLLLSGTDSGDSPLQAGFPAWKQGPGTATDATPLVGPLASPDASGGAGQGASGNPLTPAATTSTTMTSGGPWHIDLNDPTGIGKWLSDEHWVTHFGQQDFGAPGQPGDKAPNGAPAAAIDTSSVADNRLGGLWDTSGLRGSSEYYGVKPGRQTGSPNWDDTRNQRLPLPGVWGAGGWGYGPIQTILPAIDPSPQYDAYGHPIAPNPGSGGDKGGGSPHTATQEMPTGATYGDGLHHWAYGQKGYNGDDSGDDDNHDWSQLQKGYDSQNNDWGYLHQFNQDWGNMVHDIRTTLVNQTLGPAGPAVNQLWDDYDRFNARVHNWETGVRKKLGNAIWGPGYSAIDDRITDVVDYAGEMTAVAGTILGAGELAQGASRGMGGGLGTTVTDATVSDAATGQALRNAGDGLPELVFERNRMANIAPKIDAYHDAGYPNEYTYVGNDSAGKALAKANNRAAMKGVPKAGPKLANDEWPPRVTNQGGSGAWVSAVPEGENFYQGGKIGSFVKGKPSGFKFKVRIDD